MPVALPLANRIGMMKPPLTSVRDMASLNARPGDLERLLPGFNEPTTYPSELPEAIKRADLPDDRVKQLIEQLGKLPTGSPIQDMPQTIMTTPIREQRPEDQYSTMYVGAEPDEEGVFSPIWRDKPRKEISDKDAKFDFDKLGGDGVKELVGNLGDALEHKELYDKYPHIKNARILISRDLEKSGAYDPDRNTLVVGVKNSPNMENTVLHEIQHAIQEKEGWARGGSPSVASIPKEDLADMIMKHIKEISKHKSPEQADKAQANLMKAFKGTGGDFVSKINKDAILKEAYMRLAGEVEARDTSARKGMSLQERRSISPYSSQGVKAKDIIVRKKLPEKVGKLKGN